MKKTVKMLLALVMAAAMLFAAIPVSAASANENFNTVVAHINNNPDSYQEEDGYKSLNVYVEQDGGEVWWYIWNQSNGIKFGTIIVLENGTEKMAVQMEFLLRKGYTTVNTDFFMGLLYNDQYYDYVEVSKSFSKTAITATSEYTGFSASENGFISAEEVKEMYNGCLQSICMFWNAYFIRALGFGLDGLGFSKYKCPHTYTNDCDTDCDLCGESRKTEHSYNEWSKADENNHSHTCQICGNVESEQHKWSVEEIIKMPTEEEDGIISYSCKTCNAQKTVDVAYKPGDLEVDGFVDNKDVEYLLWHTLYPEDYPLPGNGDYDNNSSVDNKDVEYLLWHTLFPEDYPLTA